MKTTLDYIDDLKAHYGVESDYAVAKILGLGRAQMSSYRTGRSRFDDYMAARVAEILGLDPLEVIANINAERERRPEVKKYWERLAKQLHRSAAAVVGVAILAGVVGLGTPSNSAAYERSATVNVIHYAN